MSYTHFLSRETVSGSMVVMSKRFRSGVKVTRVYSSPRGVFHDLRLAAFIIGPGLLVFLTRAFICGVDGEFG